jgi:hypothetical protein
MKRAITLMLLSLAALAHAEVHFKTLTATTTSQTYPFPTPLEVVGVCNYGTVNVHIRLFVDGETAAAATTGDGSGLVVAGSATAPTCKAFGSGRTQRAPFSSISYISASSTATVRLEAL